LAWVCFVIVFTQNGNRAHEVPPISYSAYVWTAVYKGYVRNLFIILVIVLSGGGLLQERSLGTAGFTLALPVSRWRLMFVHAGLGLVEVAFLALVPALVITVISPLVGEHYPLNQALQFSILWAVGGAVMFGAAVLCSTVLAGEYSGWIVCFLCMMLYSAAFNITGFQQFPSFDFFKIMSGLEMPYLSRTTYKLVGPMPWLPLSVMLGVAMGFIAAAGRSTQRRDF
jgi:ABC-type transport system involved in multi-copper enzyme maturation permease subunit